MRFINETVNAPALAASTNFPAYNITHLKGFAIAGNLTNASGLNCTFKVQASNNAFLNNVNNNPNPAALWEDLPGSTFTFTANGQFMYNTESAYYTAFRLVYTNVAGTVDAIFYITAKGVI